MLIIPSHGWYWLLLAPPTLKLCAFAVSQPRHSIYHHAQSSVCSSYKQGARADIKVRKYSRPGVGNIAIRGPDFYLKQFGRGGSYGTTMASTQPFRSPIDRARQLAECAVVVTAGLLPIITCALFSVFTDVNDDAVPWIWLLYQVVCTSTWTYGRAYGMTEVGSTTYLLGEALSYAVTNMGTPSHVILTSGNGFLGVEARLLTARVRSHKSQEGIMDDLLKEHAVIDAEMMKQELDAEGLGPIEDIAFATGSDFGRSEAQLVATLTSSASSETT